LFECSWHRTATAASGRGPSDYSSLVPRTITLISDACYGGLGCWAQGHPLIWRLNKADLEACGFILPTGREPSEAEKKEVDFDHINILEFVAVIVNIGVAVRYLMLQPRRTAHVIMNVLSDNTSALSWMKHAARTKKKPVCRLARFLQALLTYYPLPIRVQGDHIKGDESTVADLLSQFSLAPHWASVIAQTSPTLDLSKACQVPQELLFDLNAAIFDWTRLGTFTGSRVSEYAQTSARKGTFSRVPDSLDAGDWKNTPIVFMFSDSTFLTKAGCIVPHNWLQQLRHSVRELHIRFRFDKIPRNFTIRKFRRSGHYFLCPILGGHSSHLLGNSPASTT